MAKNAGPVATPKGGMVKVKCPKVGGEVRWANASKSGPRCTTCGQTGHETAR